MANDSMKFMNEKVGEELLKKGFIKKIDINKNIFFEKESIAYKINFIEQNKQFELIKYTFNDKNEPENPTIVSTWLFDPENDTNKELKSIAEDFVETIVGTEAKIVHTARKKKKSATDEENNTNSLFLINRIANIFPELKEPLKEEKDHYENFRAVTFTREKVLPVISNLLLNKNPEDKFKKLCNVFSNLYDSGDLDVRGIITIVILNSITDENARKNVENQVSDKLKTAMIEAYKIKGKKIKPEKIKKKSTFFSNALNATSSQEKNY